MIKDIFDMYHGKKPTGFFKHYLFLFSMVEGLEAKNTFEFGTGLSTACIIDALRITGGKHISCDINPINMTGLDEQFVKDNSDIWTFHQCDSSDMYRKQMEPIDFMLHDGSHDPKILEEDIMKNIKQLLLKII